MAALLVLLVSAVPTWELRLFSVQKSDNRNELVYFVRVDASCRPIPERPVVVRWHMRERGDDQWEQLMPIESAFYDLADQAHVGTDRLLTHVRAAPEHPFVVRTLFVNGHCRASAEADLNGTSAIVVAKVAVELGFLSVRQATVFGQDSAGRSIAARIR